MVELRNIVELSSLHKSHHTHFLGGGSLQLTTVFMNGIFLQTSLNFGHVLRLYELIHADFNYKFFNNQCTV